MSRLSTFVLTMLCAACSTNKQYMAPVRDISMVPTLPVHKVRLSNTPRDMVWREISPHFTESVSTAASPVQHQTHLAFTWPLHGKMKEAFSKSHKGLLIDGVYGESVYAAAPGKVVYSGHGLRGYGNLLIIKHNTDYLSAYAYNSRLLVHDGDIVKRGQKIAEVGEASATQPGLYFEVRYIGKPVNPLLLLKMQRERLVL